MIPVNDICSVHAWTEKAALFFTNINKDWSNYFLEKFESISVLLKCKDIYTYTYMGLTCILLCVLKQRLEHNSKSLQTNVLVDHEKGCCCKFSVCKYIPIYIPIIN